MKVLVIGASGFTGSYLYDLFKQKYKIVGSSRKDGSFINLDLSNAGECKKMLEEVKPDLISLSAGITHMDLCEEKPEETRKINVLATEIIVDYCLKNNTKLIFFSTDAVFDGENGPYTEDDKINPTSEYGKQKYESEQIIKKLKNYLIIRTTTIYGWDNRRTNFIARLIDTLNEGKEFKTPIDQTYTPTYVVDLAKITVVLVEKDFNGIINVAGPDFISRYDFALKACEVFDLKKDLVKPVKTSDLNQMAPRLKKGGLICKKLKDKFNIEVRSVEEGLNDMFNTKNNYF